MRRFLGPVLGVVCLWRWGDLEDRDQSSIEIVASPDDRHLASGLPLTDQRRLFENLLDLNLDIGGDGVVDGVAGEILGLADGGLDFVEEVADVTGDRLTIYSGGHGSAAFVAQHHQQWRFQQLDGIFQAAQHLGRDDIARHANVEQITQTLVK
jgi:hypothetical protein